MTTIETARTRAEEMVHTLQKRARDFLEAEEGLVKAVRALLEEKGLNPADVRKRLEDMLGRIRANSIYSDAVSAIAGYRGEFGRRIDDGMHRILQTLSLASKDDVQELSRQVATLNMKMAELSKKMTGQN